MATWTLRDNYDDVHNGMPLYRIYLKINEIIISLLFNAGINLRNLRINYTSHCCERVSSQARIWNKVRHTGLMRIGAFVRFSRVVNLFLCVGVIMTFSFIEKLKVNFIISFAHTFRKRSAYPDSNS